MMETTQDKISPWKGNDDAFVQMYDESVVISGTRQDGNFKQTIEVALFVDYTDDPTNDDMIDTTIEYIHLCCRPEDVAFILKLRRGDLIERTTVNGRKYSVQEVKRDYVMGWTITARSI